MSRDKQIEEMACKNCIHYEVCTYVNAQAVEYARAENCKLFKNNAGYRKASEVAREISGMLREDLRGFVDGDYLERLLTIYEKKYTEEK